MLLASLSAVVLLSLASSAYATSPPPGQGWTVETRSYNGNGSSLNLKATHAYVTGTDIADFDFPQSTSGYASYLWLSSNSGYTETQTVSATFTITVTGSASFVYGPWGSETQSGSPTVRLFFQSNLPANGGSGCMPAGFNENNYWWSNPTDASVGSYQITGPTSGEVTLSVQLNPADWSNLCGHDGTSLGATFDSAIANIQYIGFSFGSGNRFASGVAVTAGSGSATFELSSFSVQ